jgi:hypothetical protein
MLLRLYITQGAQKKWTHLFSPIGNSRPMILIDSKAIATNDLCLAIGRAPFQLPWSKVAN